MHVNRLVHAVFGNCVSASDVSLTNSLDARVSEFMCTQKPRKAVPYVEGMTLVACHSFLIVPLVSASQRETLMATDGCQHG